MEIILSNPHAYIQWEAGVVAPASRTSFDFIWWRTDIKAHIIQAVEFLLYPLVGYLNH